MSGEIIRVEPLSSYLERYKAPASVMTRHGNMLYVSGLPPLETGAIRSPRRHGQVLPAEW
jgi:enamine deaminase RidA (YjgF/YER057c/UK114 family)